MVQRTAPVSSQGTEHVSPLKDLRAPALKTPIKGIAFEALKKDDDFEELSDFPSKATKESPVGLIATIKKYFERRFSEIKDCDRQKAQDINLLIGKVEQKIHNIANLAREAAYKERSLRGQFPNKDTLEVTETHLVECCKQLEKAKAHLDALKKEEDAAIELADKHSAYGSLPGQIQALENNIAYLNARCLIADELLELEEEMVEYQPEETWEQFVVCDEKKKELAQALRDIVNEHPVVKDDPIVQKYSAMEKWNAHDIYLLIKSCFPGLTNHVERLFDCIVNIQRKRIDHLHQKVEDLKPLFSKYAAQSKQISDLEEAVYSNSLSARFYRVFFKKKDLKARLQKVIEKQKNIYNTIKKEAKFNNDEIDWLERIATTSLPEKMDLRKDIEALRRGTSYINIRQNLSDKMNQLLKHLEFYRIHNMHALDKESTQFVNIKKLEAALKKDIQEIAENVKNWSYKQGVLPKNFTKMDVIDQLNIVISLSFPTLKKRSGFLFKSIEEQGLHDTLNEAIKEGKLPTAAEDELEELLETELEEESLPSEEELLVNEEEITSEEPGAVPSDEAISESSNESDSSTESSSDEIPARPNIEHSEEKSSETTILVPPPPPPPPPPPLPDDFFKKPATKPAGKQEEYKKVEGEKSETKTKKPVDPSELLNQIKKGTPLTHVEPFEKPTGERMPLLEEIEAGTILKKVEPQEKVKQLTAADYAKKIENGEMKMNEIPQDFRDTLTAPEILLLQMASKRTGIDGIDDTSHDDEWDDDLENQ